MLRVHEWLQRLAESVRGSYRGYEGVKARLDLNEIPYPPSPRVLEAVSREAVRLNRYPEPELKKRLISLLAEYSGVGEDNIVVGCGADLILQHLFYTVSKPGDVVVVPYPAFFAYDKMFGVLGLSVSRVMLREDGEWWRLSVDEVVRLVESDERVRLIVIDNPNNPTGSLLVKGIDEARRIVEAAASRGALVVFDEAYYEFSGVTFANLVREYDNVAIVRTMSKAFALAGARMGYAILPVNLAKILSTILPPFPPRLSMAAAIAALEDLDYSRRLIETVSAERERVRSELNSIPGVKAYASRTNFLLVRTPVRNIVSALDRLGIAVRGVPLGDEWMRVSIGSREENEEFISILKSIVSGV